MTDLAIAPADLAADIRPARPVATPRRLRRGSWSGESLATLAAAAGGSVALTWLLFERLLPLSGLVGVWLVTYAVFVGLYALLVAATEGGVAMRDRIAAVVFTTAGLLLVTAL